MPDPWRNRGLRALAGLWVPVAILAMLGTPGPTRAQAPEPVPEAVPELPESIALSDVVARAEALATELRKIERQLEPGKTIASIEQQLPDQESRLAERLTATQERTTKGASLQDLRALESEWKAQAEPLEAWARRLADRAASLETTIESLDRRADLWKRTREAARKGGAPAPVLGRIGEVRSEIGRVRKAVAVRRDQVLTLQSRVSAQQTLISDARVLIDEAQGGEVRQLAKADAPFAWSSAFWDQLRRELDVGFVESLSQQWEFVRVWFGQHRSRLPAHGLLLVFLWLALRGMDRLVRNVEEKTPRLSRAQQILHQPAATALLLFILATPWLYPEAPQLIVQTLFLGALLPTVVILRPHLEPPLQPVLYGLVGFFLVDRLREVVAPMPGFARLLLLLELAAAVGFLIVLLRPARLARVPAEMANSAILRLSGPVLRGGLVLLGVALLAGAIGYTRLSRYLGNAVLGSAYLAVIAYAAVRILNSLLDFAWRVAPLRHLHLVRRNLLLLERRSYFALRLTGLVVWGVLTLRLLDLSEPLSDGLRDLLGAELSVGALRLSLGDVAAFGVTIAAAFLLSRFLRFVLQEDVFPRTRLERGMPYAITTLLHYVILLVGFFLAVVATGLDLNRFALLAGAFGVGLGFGLQNIVNNFVSGLILLFERPIQIGDRVEVSGAFGEVRRIGIRASVIRTFDGAEVVVPNGSLISEPFTNWTLSDRSRRVRIEVGVAYGTSPERVLDLLREVAEAHPQVVVHPEPQALFLGFGDSSLNFRLLGWISSFDNGLTVQSELAVAVNRTLKDAGIEIPFPQRDLHLKSVAPTIRGTADSG